MQIKLSKAADKFLRKVDGNSRKAIIAKIGILKTCLETQQVYPPDELDKKSRKSHSLASLEFG
ncbi:MAG: hypothetical protein AAFR26_23355 [Cyanobacteria bacterium J06626_4]